MELRTHLSKYSPWSIRPSINGPLPRQAKARSREAITEMNRKAKTFGLIAVPCVLLLFVGLFVLRYLQDAPTPSPKGTATVYISIYGIEFDGKDVSLQSLGSELKRLRQDNPAIEAHVVIQGRFASRYPMMDVLGEISKAGIDHVAIVTNPLPSPSPTPTGQAPIS